MYVRREVTPLCGDYSNEHFIMSSNFSHATGEFEILLLAQYIKLFGIINGNNRNTAAVVHVYNGRSHYTRRNSK